MSFNSEYDRFLLSCIPAEIVENIDLPLSENSISIIEFGIKIFYDGRKSLSTRYEKEYLDYKFKKFNNKKDLSLDDRVILKYHYERYLQEI